MKTGISSFVPATVESRLLVSGRRSRELHAAPDGIEIEVAAPIDHATRALQAPELASMPSNGNAQ